MFYITTNIQSKLKLICVVFSEVFWDALLMTSNGTKPSFLSSWVPWVFELQKTIPLQFMLPYLTMDIKPAILATFNSL